MMFFRRRKKDGGKNKGRGSDKSKSKPSAVVPVASNGPSKTEAGPEKDDNPLHLHIDCTRGISARSLLDGLRELARCSKDRHSRDAFQLDALSASIWTEHIPEHEKKILQEGRKDVNQELPVKSWEPFRRVLVDVPSDASEIVTTRLRELLDTLEQCYKGDVPETSPLVPSVVWHMMAVVLLLDRLRIKDMTCSEVPRDVRSSKVLRDLLKPFPEAKATGDEETVKTTFDGAVLLKVLKPASPFAPNLEFHGKAVGKDCSIKTELGMGVVVKVAEKPPTTSPETAPRYAPTNQGKTASPPLTTKQAQRVERPKSNSRQAPSTAAPLDERTKNSGTIPEEPGQTPVARQRPEAATRGPEPVEVVKQQIAVPPEAEETQDKLVAEPSPVEREERRVQAMMLQGVPRPTGEEETSALVSSLWNVDSNLTLLATNIDDMTAEHLAFCAELLIAQGAADVWVTPIYMKKGRAAQQLNCLATDELTQALLVTIFKQTTTLGVRVWSSAKGLQRVSLRREIITVEYCRRPMNVKVAYLGKEAVSIKPEYDQCRQLALDTQIPISTVTDEVKALAKDSQRRQLLSMV